MTGAMTWQVLSDVTTESKWGEPSLIKMLADKGLLISKILVHEVINEDGPGETAGSSVRLFHVNTPGRANCNIAGPLLPSPT